MGKQSSCEFCHYFESMVQATKLATGLNYILYVSYGSVVYLLTDKLNLCFLSGAKLCNKIDICYQILMIFCILIQFTCDWITY